MMDRGLSWTGLDRFMTVNIGADSCHLHKPDPFPVQLAIEKLGYASAEAIFVGDSPHDIASGNAAGVATVAALWGPFTREQLAPYHPTRFIERITDLPRIIAELESGV
jgi:pyrophosphatase PpaX